MGDAAEAVVPQPEPQRERMTLERARALATLDVDDVADLLGIHPKTAYALAQRKKIPGRLVELGRAVRFRSRVVIAWLEGAPDASGKTR